MPSVRKTPLGHFLHHHFFVTAETQIYWANFEKPVSSGQSGKIWSVLHFWGCGLPSSVAILRHSAAILRRPVPDVGFCLEFKSLFWAPKKLKKDRFWQKTLREYFGFSAAILRKILKGQNLSPNGPACIFQRSQRASEVLQALSPLTATNLFVLAAWWIFGVATRNFQDSAEGPNNERRSRCSATTKRRQSKRLNAVVAAQQEGMNVELLSAGSHRVIMRVRKLVVYLSSSQVTSKTAKFPKAQRVTEITTEHVMVAKAQSGFGVDFCPGKSKSLNRCSVHCH